MTAVYYAGPLFTAAERSWNAANAQALRVAFPQLDWRLPQEFCAHHEAGAVQSGEVDFDAIFRLCRRHLDACQLVVAILDGADPDSGTSWEVGYAYARGLPVIGWRTDLRPGEGGLCNCMLSHSCVGVGRSLAEVVALLRGQLPLTATA